MHAVHDLPDELGPGVLVSLFHRVYADCRDIHIVDLAIAVGVIHFFRENRVTAADIEHLESWDE